MRALRVRVSRRRGIDCPHALAEAVTDWLMGRTDHPPTIRLTAARRHP